MKLFSFTSNGNHNMELRYKAPCNAKGRVICKNAKYSYIVHLFSNFKIWLWLLPYHINADWWKLRLGRPTTAPITD